MRWAIGEDPNGGEYLSITLAVPLARWLFPRAIIYLSFTTVGDDSRSRLPPPSVENSGKCVRLLKGESARVDVLGRRGKGGRKAAPVGGFALLRRKEVMYVFEFIGSLVCQMIIFDQIRF